MQKPSLRSKVAGDAAVLVLGSDTVVSVDDMLLGKPVSADDAVRMLVQLSGRIHRVCTAVSLASRESSASLLSETKVQFRQITESGSACLLEHRRS